MSDQDTTAEDHATDTMKMDPDRAEEVAAHAEMLFADLGELRRVRDELAPAGSAMRTVGARTDVTEARVALLEALNKATLGDLKGDGAPHAILFVSEAEAGEAVVAHMEFFPPYNNHDESDNPLCHKAVGHAFVAMTNWMKPDA